MTYLALLFIIWAAAMFHLWEHRKMEASLAALAAALNREKPEAAALKGFLYLRDWRMICPAENGFILRRAFNPTGKTDFLRYAVPPVLLVIMLTALESPLTGLFYLALLAIRWFLSAIALMPQQDHAFYKFLLFGRPLFSGALPKP